MSRERGFTLLEMMVATVILAVAVVGLLSALSGATRNAARLTDYDRAVQLARLRMNELLVDQRFPLNTAMGAPFDRDLAGGMDAGWRARITNFEMPPAPAPGETSLQRLELEVWWMSGGLRHSFTLDGYRPHLLKPEELR
jgi:general secretion pathway protein I